MSTAGGNASKIAIAGIIIAIVAITLGAYSFSQAVSLQQQNSNLEQKLNALQQPKTQRIKVILGEGEVVQAAVLNETTGETKLISEEMGGEEMLTGEFHRWEPTVIVVKKGDTVELTVVNPRSHAHSFVLDAFQVDTGRIPGRTEKPNEVDRTVVKTFTANQAGVFSFRCGISFDHAQGNCDADHARMIGYLIVLE